MFGEGPRKPDHVHIARMLPAAAAFLYLGLLIKTWLHFRLLDPLGVLSNTRNVDQLRCNRLEILLERASPPLLGCVALPGDGWKQAQEQSPERERQNLIPPGKEDNQISINVPVAKKWGQRGMVV